MFDEISVHMRGLEALGITSDQYGSIIIPVIMERLPSEVAILVARKTKNDVWSIQEMMEP